MSLGVVIFEVEGVAITGVDADAINIPWEIKSGFTVFLSVGVGEEIDAKFVKADDWSVVIRFASAMLKNLTSATLNLFTVVGPEYW